MERVISVLCLMCSIISCSPAASPSNNGTVPAASATVETQPVRGGGDSADDAAIWVHPDDRSRSLILGTDSKTGLAVYDLQGNERAFHKDGATGMVDLRYGFPTGKKKTAIVAAGNLADNRIALYRVDRQKRNLREVSAREIHPELTIYGLCMYHNPDSNSFYVFVTSGKGEVEQWQLHPVKNGGVDAKRVRQFTLNPEGPDSDYTIEGCVADDRHGRLYLAREDFGYIWRVPADANVAMNRTLVDKPKSKGGHTTPDVEGLAIYPVSNGSGYLLASNQGNYTYNVYKRTGENPYLMSFKIGAGDRVDGASSDDSLEVTPSRLNATFPEGMLVVEDGDNTAPGPAGNNNYKMVRWEKIANLHSPGLKINPEWSPR